MAITVLTYQQALTDSAKFNARHLLLGNGFSIACIPTIFSYNSLFDETNFDKYPQIKDAFNRLGTTDFELVIHALEKGSRVLPSYLSGVEKTVAQMTVDAQKIKELLIETIASRHPALPSDIPDEKFKACRSFLSNFVNEDSSGKIYSLNYDLLLYWTLLHEFDDEAFKLKHNDGFGRDSYVDSGEVYVSDYLTWQGKSDGQNVHYLHGALHLFDSGHELEKFSWVDKGIPLIEQCRSALAENKFPLFVTEGEHDKKMEKITHSAYLFNTYESFNAVAMGGKSKKPGNTCLFTYGVSFSANDEHIFGMIAHGRIKQLYVGIYGDPSSEANKQVFKKAEALKLRRKDFPLEIAYYDVATANVWGN